MPEPAALTPLSERIRSHHCTACPPEIPHTTATRESWAQESAALEAELAQAKAALAEAQKLLSVTSAAIAGKAAAEHRVADLAKRNDQLQARVAAFEDLTEEADKTIINMLCDVGTCGHETCHEGRAMMLRISRVSCSTPAADLSALRARVLREQADQIATWQLTEPAIGPLYNAGWAAAIEFVVKRLRELADEEGRG